MQPRHIISRAFLALTLFTLSAGLASADHVLITRHFSGIWNQPDHRSQGFVLQISEAEDEQKIGVVYWFTYDEDFTPAWYLAAGPVNGHQIDMILYKSSGVAFLETGIEGNPEVAEIGTLVMDFRNCNQGTAAYETSGAELGTGEVRIKRLTSLYRMRCSGGISDDTPGNAKPKQLEVQLVSPTDEGPGAGKAKFWERPDRSDLKVTVEGVTDGTYALEVCETLRGDFEVTEGEGSIQFRSPAIPGKALLDFDPRNCRLDIRNGNAVVLTSGDEVLAPKARGGKDDDDEGDGNEVDVDLDNTGILGSAKGAASLEEDGDGTRFKVKLMKVPAGEYPLNVGGDEKGIIVVTQGNGQGNSAGELRFSDPQKEGEIELNFSPGGQWIEIYDGDDVILETLFPDS